MRRAVRLIGAVLAGIVLAFMLIRLAERVVTHYYPLRSVNPTVAELIEQAATMPLPGLLMVLAGYILSSFFGGYLAARLSSHGQETRAAFIVGFFLLLCGIVLFISIPHPLWMALCSGVSFLLFSWLGGRLGR